MFWSRMSPLIFLWKVLHCSRENLVTRRAQAKLRHLTAQWSMGVLVMGIWHVGVLVMQGFVPVPVAVGS